MNKEGMIGFSNNKKGFLPAIIRFFTKSKISHAFIVARNYGDQASVQEAGMVVQLGPLERLYTNNPSEDYWIYDCTKVTLEQKLKALDYCFKEYAIVEYGYLQLLWFVYRWFCVEILKQNNKDVTRRNNWLSKGVICSELQYEYLIQLGGEYAELVRDFNQDTIQAEDLRLIVASRPDLFCLIEYKTDNGFLRQN
jgi:hypothetical protein